MLKFFQRKSRQKPATPPREVTGEALRAVPRRSPVAEKKIDTDTGKVYLRLPIKARNPLTRAINQKTGWKRYRQFDLDPVGSEFWELCNGTRSLAQIETALRRKHGWQPQECREAVVQYTMTLTTRELLFLDLSHRKSPAAS